jgi:hypothetical protein
MPIFSPDKYHYRFKKYFPNTAVFSIAKTALAEQQLNPLYCKATSLVSFGQSAKFDVGQQRSVERLIRVRMKCAYSFDWRNPKRA